MQKNRIYTYLLILFFIISVSFVYYLHLSAKNNIKDGITKTEVDNYYNKLLSTFPMENQGYGLDVLSDLPDNQPMTYGLLLSSESIKYKHYPSEEGKTRIYNSIRWLLNNSDLDKDGNPGWGLPDEWDAFSDGSVNPKNTPYTITTAIVVEGFLNALSIDNFFTTEEREIIINNVVDTAIFWCQSMWTETTDGGYFWYSPLEQDSVFAVNASSMITGTFSEFLLDYDDYIDEESRELIFTRVHESARSIINNAYFIDGLPYWDYLIQNDTSKINNRPNDLVHHTYILWGMELFRELSPNSITWTRNQAGESLTKFVKADEIYEFPQNIIYDKEKQKIPARLWGVGMMMAFFAKYYNIQDFYNVLKITIKNYSNDDYTLTLYPKYYDNNFKYYPRFAAHVLFGIAQIYDKL